MLHDAVATWAPIYPLLGFELMLKAAMIGWLGNPGTTWHQNGRTMENTDELCFFSFNVFWQYYPLAISEFTMENGWFVDDLLEKWGGFSMGMLDPQRARSTLDEPHVEGPYNTWIGEHSPKR